jgi:hypothetical protein
METVINAIGGSYSISTTNPDGTTNTVVVVPCRGLIDQGFIGSDPMGHCCANRAVGLLENREGITVPVCEKCKAAVEGKWDADHANYSVSFFIGDELRSWHRFPSKCGPHAAARDTHAGAAPKPAIGGSVGSHSDSSNG